MEGSGLLRNAAFSAKPRKKEWETFSREGNCDRVDLQRKHIGKQKNCVAFRSVVCLLPELRVRWQRRLPPVPPGALRAHPAQLGQGYVRHEPVLEARVVLVAHVQLQRARARDGGAVSVVVEADLSEKKV